MKTKQVFDAYDYPQDGEYVIYYFQPFEKWYTGFFEMGEEYGPGVSGKNGFTTWHTEVTMWMKGVDDE